MARRLALVLALVASLALTAPALAAQKPKIGRTAVLRPVSGKVLVRARGKSKFTRLRRALTVPIGSTVDVTSGRVNLATAKNKRGSTQSGEFRGGEFTIAQKKSNPLTELRLAGNGACGASASGVHAARRRRRSLFGHAHGHFRTRGRKGSATIRGTTWVTSDLCDGSTLIQAVAGGHVTAKSETSTQDLKPGQSYQDFCSDNGLSGVSDLYCMDLFSDPADDVFGLAIVTFDPGSLGGTPGTAPSDVDVCIRNPQGVDEPCRNYPLESLGGGARIQSDGCSPASGTGTYTVHWRLEGHDLPVPLTYTSTHKGAGTGCVNSPNDPAP